MRLTSQPSPKVIYGPDGKTITEIDYLAVSGKIREVDKFSRGLVQSATKYLPDGSTVSEVDTYAYAGGVLSMISVSLPLLHEQLLYSFDSKGTMSEIDLSKLNNSGVLLETDKFSLTKMAKEADYYTGGKLTSVALYNSIGELTTYSTYSQTTGALTEVDAFQYSGTSRKPTNETKTDETGKLVETDTFSYGLYGFLSKITKTNGSGTVTEVDQYDLYGRLVSVTHPTAVVSSPPINSAWSTASGYGACDALKGLDTALGKTLTDVAAPAYVQAQWDLMAMQFDDVWAAGYTGKGVVIADIDTGIDLKNASLMQNLSTYDWNFVNNSSNVQDDNGHGTCTASELVAANNGNKVTGGAYGAQLMVLKALDSTGAGSDTNIAAAINYAVAHNAKVINLSLGGGSPDTLLSSALSNAVSHGVVVCMAAGNDGESTPTYPATYAESLSTCIAVGATQQSRTSEIMAPFSNCAGSSTAYNFVDAPGSSILGYGLNNVISDWAGTSMATPLVAAEAADIFSANTTLSATQVVQDIIHSTITLASSAAAAASALLHG